NIVTPEEAWRENQIQPSGKERARMKGKDDAKASRDEITTCAAKRREGSEENRKKLPDQLAVLLGSWAGCQKRGDRSGVSLLQSASHRAGSTVGDRSAIGANDRHHFRRRSADEQLRHLIQSIAVQVALLDNKADLLRQSQHQAARAAGEDA